MKGVKKQEVFSRIYKKNNWGNIRFLSNNILQNTNRKHQLY